MPSLALLQEDAQTYAARPVSHYNNLAVCHWLQAELNFGSTWQEETLIVSDIVKNPVNIVQELRIFL